MLAPPPCERSPVAALYEVSTWVNGHTEGEEPLGQDGESETQGWSPEETLPEAHLRITLFIWARPQVGLAVQRRLSLYFLFPKVKSI